MQQIMQKCVLPVKCSRCGTIFDLSYEVSIDEGMYEEFLFAMKHRKIQGGMFCWDCR
ncbi:MAG: hypothetical protein AABX11_04135 [Nanoarchaeota archaeon]